MDAVPWWLAATAAVVPASALTMRAARRWPRPPVAEAAVIVLLGAVCAITVLDGRARPVPDWVVAATMLAWLGFLLTFPSGRSAARPLKVVAIVGAAGVIAGAVGLGDAWGSGFFIGAFAVLAAGQVWRYSRRSSIAERQATKWLMLGLIPAVAVFLGVGLIAQLPAAPPALLEHPAYLAASTAGMWAVPLAASVALVARDRGPVDEAVRYTVAASGIAVASAAAYVAVRGFASPAWAAVASSAITIPAALAFLRLGTWIAYSRGPQRTLAQLPARLGAAGGPDDVGGVVTGALRDALGSPVAEVWVAGELLARQGDGEVAVARIVSAGGEPVAEVRVACRPGDPELSPRDRATLDRIMLIATPALRAAAAAREADLAHARAARARTDERRRLHADLHDELGPSLAGLGYVAQAAARELDGDAPHVVTMLQTISEATRGLVTRVREICYDLRPSRMDGASLERILAERVQHAHDGLRIDLDCDGVDDAVAPDVVLIVQEAVMNVRRHAGARSCTVKVSADEAGRVTIEVADDGGGVADGVREGIGLASMRARARRHGGELTLVSTSGGSRLIVTLEPGEADDA